MEDRETARMRKYGESKTTRIMMATVPHVTSGMGLRKFQADGFLFTRVYNLGRFSKHTQISNFMKIRPVGAELLLADGRTDRQTGRQNRQT